MDTVHAGKGLHTTAHTHTNTRTHGELQSSIEGLNIDTGSCAKLCELASAFQCSQASKSNLEYFSAEVLELVDNVDNKRT